MPMILVESEGGTEIVKLTAANLKKIKRLMEVAQEEGEWPDEVNDILDEGEIVQVAGTLNTMGDGWGWYGEEE